jgi:hypothetical protein
MNCLRDNYDLIAVAVLIATLAFAPSPDTLDRSLKLVNFEQPQVVIVHE